MTQDPNGFTTVTLDSLGTFLRGSSISKSDLTASGIGVVLYGELYTTFDGVIDRPQSFASRSSVNGSPKIEFGDILFPTAGESADEIGKPSVYLSRERAHAGGDLIVFRPLNSQMGEYLVSALRTNAAYAYRYSMGQGQSIVHISQSALERHPVLIVDCDKANRISQIIATWDRAIRAAECLFNEKSRYKQFLLQHATTSKAADWKVASLGDLFKNRKSKGTEGVTTFSVTIDHGLVPRGSIDRKNDTSLQPDQHLLIEKGDIAYNMMRMWQGASGLAAETGLVSPAYVVIRSCGEVDPLFASYWFKTPRVIKKFQDYSHGLTNDRLRLYYKDFASISLPVPPLDLQRKIARTLAACDRELDLLRRKLDLLKQQKKGLMQRLLTGKVRVKVPEGVA